MQVPEPGFIVVGSPLQKDFGERNDEKGFWILDTEEEPRTPIFIPAGGPKFYKIEVKKADELELPKGFTDKDFLWVVSEDSSIHKSPLLAKIGDRVRIDVKVEAAVKLRTDIGLNLTIPDQLKKYIQYVKPNLDEEKLLKIGLDKFREAVS
jgi:hypothetical protein